VIRQHDFNASWWGAPIGIVADPEALLGASPDEVQAACAPFEWVELRLLADAVVDHVALLKRGFFNVDTQIRFRVGLPRLRTTPSLERLQVRFAHEDPFEVEAADILPLGSERYSVLPGATEDRMRERYVLWSQLLLRESPEHCLQVHMDGAVQGHFLSRSQNGRLNLTLAMLHPEATVSGMLLFHKALLAYASRDERVGHASFRATNTAVLNIYSSLGARFLTPELFWFRLRG
jgi:hypothetical protein